MPPNIKEVLYHIDQAALPYSQPAYKNINNGCKENKEDNQESSENRNSENGEEDFESVSNVRVTTRARLSYELDRYAKNAMLIIDNRMQLNSTYENYNLKETFEKFRFEVELYEDITRDEIIAVSERFFQKDFSEYGAVVVAIMADVNAYKQYIAKNSSFAENDVLKYFTTNQPPSLQGKPKISIVEASDYYYDKRSRIQEPDCLRYHLPVTYTFIPNGKNHPASKLLAPIQILCKHVIEEGNKVDLYTLMVSSVVACMKEIDVYKMYPIKVESTLKKDLMLFETTP